MDKMLHDSGKKSKAAKKERTLERASSEEDLLAEQSKPKKTSRFAKKLVHGKGKDKKVSDASISSATTSDDKERWSYVNEQPARPVFATPLNIAIMNNKSHDAIPVPLVVRLAIDYVTQHGLTSEGIYRLSAPKLRLDDLRLLVEQGDEPTFQDPSEAAALLKLFLREMPDHLLTNELIGQFEDDAKGCPCGLNEVCICLAGDRIKARLMQLPVAHYWLAGYVCHHFRVVASMSKYNKMDLCNLGVLLHRTLDMSARLLAILLLNTGTKVKDATRLFHDISIKKYVAPLVVSDDLYESLPDSLPQLEEEMRKQHSLLDELHADVSQMTSKGLTLPVKEQQLWDVQKIITQLRRKMRSLKQQRTIDDTEKEKDNASTNAGTGVAGPCVEMFEEKQLLAVNAELDHQLEEQRRAIAALIQQLPPIAPVRPAPLPPTSTSSTHTQTPSAEPPATTTEPGPPNSTSTDPAQIDWKHQCWNEERRHEQLVVEIIAEKNRIARLRAEIELFVLQRRHKMATGSGSGSVSGPGGVGTSAAAVTSTAASSTGAGGSQVITTVTTALAR